MTVHSSLLCSTEVCMDWILGLLDPDSGCVERDPDSGFLNKNGILIWIL